MNMLTDTLIKLFERDLNKLSTEIGFYNEEENLWRVEKEITNSAGNLCLHLIGNLNHFIGAQLGKTDYIRHRELEFSLKNVPRTELQKNIANTIKMINSVLNNLSPADLDNDYPLIVFQEKMTIEFFLVHLATHLNYHLGQINYHRRLLDH